MIIKGMRRKWKGSKGDRNVCRQGKRSREDKTGSKEGNEEKEERKGYKEDRSGEKEMDLTCKKRRKGARKGRGWMKRKRKGK